MRYDHDEMVAALKANNNCIMVSGPTLEELSNPTYQPANIPARLEDSHPELASTLQLIVWGRHPVRGFNIDKGRRSFKMADGSQIDRSPGRNQPCRCGSGKKVKNCCALNK